VKLICDNCVTFNPDDSMYYEEAEKLRYMLSVLEMDATRADTIRYTSHTGSTPSSSTRRGCPRSTWPLRSHQARRQARRSRHLRPAVPIIRSTASWSTQLPWGHSSHTRASEATPTKAERPKRTGREGTTPTKQTKKDKEGAKKTPTKADEEKPSKKTAKTPTKRKTSKDEEAGGESAESKTTPQRKKRKSAGAAETAEAAATTAKTRERKTGTRVAFDRSCLLNPHPRAYTRIYVL
jgi:hypothetical protein